MIDLIFWSSFVFVAYTYLGYPILLYLLSRIRNKHISKGGLSPLVTVVISVLNEESNIAKRIQNIIEQNYPADKLQVIIVSDGSTDRTVEIVRSLNMSFIKLVCLEKTLGKAMALNEGVRHALGEIIVFTDARQTFAPDVISNLSANFNDCNVGCVSGELLFLHLGAESCIQAEMGAYWRYEKWIRKMESCTGSVVGATGAIYAIRRELYKPLPAGTLLDDVLTPMNVVLQGFRVIFDGSAVAYDVVSKNVSQEWRRKVRTLAGNWQLFSLSPTLANPFRNSIWWRFMSHKIARLIVPFALFVLLSCGLLLDGALYRTATYLQLLFYSLAIAGVIVPASRNVRLINIIYFFIVMNAAAVAGCWKWITGQCATSWKPAHDQ